MTRALTTSTTPALALSANAQRLIRSSKAENTKTAYRKALKDFNAFLDEQHIAHWPTAADVMVQYLEHLAENNRPSTIQVKLSGLRYAYKLQGLPDPTADEVVKAVMAGIRRELGTAPSRKAAITRAKLRAMLAVFGDDLPGLRNKAILLVGFAGAFRRSELAGLDVRDVQLDDGAAIIQLRRSKTDQEGAGTVKHIPAISDATLCPVQTLIRWLNAANLTSGALFRQVDRWGHVRAGRLHDNNIALVVKKAAKAAGLDDFQFSGHSLRIGFVTQSAEEKTPEWQIQEVTGHKSTTVLRGYIRAAGVGQKNAVRRALGEKDGE